MAYTVDDELHSQSEWSPGVVNNNEVLLRTVFEPEHVVDEMVIEAAIPLSDLRSRGFSVDRSEYANKSIIHGRINRQISQLPEKRHSGLISKFDCLSVRVLLDESERAFIVIDTADEENIAHASIYSAIERRDSALRRIRSLLLPCLQKRFSLEEVFS